MAMYERLMCTGAAAALLVLAMPQQALAQAWPAKTIRLVSGASPGSASDLVGRAVSEKIQAELGVPVILENKMGAGGVIAAQHVATSAPDGYTVFVYTAAHTVTPLISKVPYDPIRDFAGVTPLAVVPNVLVVSAEKGYKSVRELVAAGKANPGKLNYASVGVGTATYMNAEKFRASAGIDAVHIPYKGSPEAITETMTGRVDYFFAPLVSALPLIKDGKLAALAVGTNKRSSLLPEVPTAQEAGVAKADYVFWIGLLVPAKTPRDVINRLNQATLKAVQTADVRERLAKLGAEPFTMSPDQFDSYIKEELSQNAEIIKAAGIKAE
jgi:tripartite-type tricarboxylate transporter receptor subunit TctC